MITTTAAGPSHHQVVVNGNRYGVEGLFCMAYCWSWAHTLKQINEAIRKAKVKNNLRQQVLLDRCQNQFPMTIKYIVEDKFYKQIVTDDANVWIRAHGEQTVEQLLIGIHGTGIIQGTFAQNLAGSQGWYNSPVSSWEVEFKTGRDPRPYPNNDGTQREIRGTGLNTGFKLLPKDASGNAKWTQTTDPKRLDGQPLPQPYVRQKLKNDANIPGSLWHHPPYEIRIRIPFDAPPGNH